jgi:hypothetical protein
MTAIGDRGQGGGTRGTRDSRILRRIGENSAEARDRIREGLEFLGIRLDQGRNHANRPLISADAARTDEESMIARGVVNLLAAASSG